MGVKINSQIIKDNLNNNQSSLEQFFEPKRNVNNNSIDKNTLFGSYLSSSYKSTSSKNDFLNENDLLDIDIEDLDNDLHFFLDNQRISSNTEVNISNNNWNHPASANIKQSLKDWNNTIKEMKSNPTSQNSFFNIQSSEMSP